MLLHHLFGGAPTSCALLRDDRGGHKFSVSLTLLCYA